MYTQKIECKNGTVMLTKTEGNVAIKALATRDDGTTWHVKNALGITDTDKWEAIEFCDGEK
mgnify:CR=1 FL=1